MPTYLLINNTTDQKEQGFHYGFVWEICCEMWHKCIFIILEAYVFSIDDKKIGK